MRETNPIRMLAQAVSLAMVALALMVGSALAHGGHGHAAPQIAAKQIQMNDAERQPGDDSSVVTSASTSTVASVAVMQASAAAPGNLGGMPCSDDHHRTGSASGTCCTIACHAALAAPAIDPPAAHEPPSVRIVGLTDMLEGRSSDRTERPPRLS